MRRAGRDLSIPVRLLAAALVVVLSLTADAMGTVTPGEPAPMLEALQQEAGISVENGEMPGPLVLVFAKRDDAHSERFVLQLRGLQERGPELFQESNGVVVLSREEVPNSFDEGALPDDWVLIIDTDDAYYTGYGIVATPTAVVISSDGTVIGYHPGYSPGLVRAVQLDLLQELRGRDVVRTPAPQVSMQVQLGRRLAERGLWERALPYYRNAEEEGPLPEEVLVEKADVLVQVGEEEEAMEIMDRLGELPRAGHHAPLFDTFADTAGVKAPAAIFFVLRDPGQEGWDAMQEAARAISTRADVVLIVPERGVTPPDLDEWAVLPDQESLYKMAYGAAVAPVAFLVDDEGNISSVHSGFVEAWTNDISGELDRGVAAPDAPEADLPIRLGRRLALLEKWDRASHYYTKTAEEDGLEQHDLREMVFILLEAGNRREAAELLEQLEELEGAEALRRRLIEEENEEAQEPPATGRNS